MGTKHNLLALLEQNRGSTVSGQEIARQLGISRAAVGKAAAALRAQGVPLQAVPGGGYSLAPQADVLTAETLRTYLPAPQYPLQVEEETASTNLAAKQWAIQGAPHGSMVVAQRQSGGRGRLGRSFASPGGGLYLSIVLRPGQSGNPVLVTAAAAVAVSRAVQQLCGIQLQIKWVNDLFYNGKKVCGILCEAATNMETGSMEYIVAGIGINYRTPQSAFAPELQPVATSLYPGGQATVPRAQLAAAVHTQLLALFETLDSRDFLPEYRAHSLVLGKQVTVLAQPPYTATAIGINDDAHLLVQTASGQTETLCAGEISIKPQV